MVNNGRILLISANETTSISLRERLAIDEGYSVSFAPTARSGLEIFREINFDMAIVKFGLPDLTGIDLVKNLKELNPDCIIIVFVEDANDSSLEEASRAGVYDFVVEPVNLEKLFFLIKKGMELHSLSLAYHKMAQGLQEQNIFLQKQNTLLAKRIEGSTKNLTRLYEDLRSTYMRTIKVLAQAIDARDHYTHRHSENVANYAVTIAKELCLSVKDIELIREACELHDLGKIGVKDDILSKPGGLTPQEWEQIKRHPFTGAQILEPLTFLNGAIDLVRQHHEHYDGSGYPEGRSGEDILLGARIIHLADAYEAMRSARSYRQIPLSKEESLSEIHRNSGTQFDPKVVEAFLKVVDVIDPG